jgi:spermidine synthase
MTARTQSHHPWFLLGVFLTCMCGLMLQIMETRVLSVIGYYYLAFFAIGVAMLGMTAGALAVFYRFELVYVPERLFDVMSGVMAAFAWSILASLLVLLNLALGANLQPTLTFVIGWIIAIFVLLPPYVLLGIAVSLALTRSAQRISLVYGVDLIGASVGCLVTLALLTVTDTYTAILLVGALGGAAALAFRRAMHSARVEPTPKSHGSSSNPALNPGVAVGALLLAAAVTQLLGTHGLRPIVVKSKIEQAYKLTEERWNSFSRIAMTMLPHSDAFLWSASPVAPHMQLDQGWLNIDGEAGTPIYGFRGDPRELEFLRYDATALAYYIRHRGRSAVIGIGGGRDLMTSSLFGFRDITGVEYNPIFVQLFARDYRAFSGANYISGLRLFVDDARSWFARSHEQFDVIQMSLIDTWAATGAGAFTLSENGLYTVNGWKRFMSRLTPTGVFTVSRWYAPERLDETARILSLATATLISMGEIHPEDHIYLASNGRLSTIIVGRAPLTSADTHTLDDTVDRLQYRTLVAPGRIAADPIFERILHAGTIDELVRIGNTTELNLTPTWDSNPFFFNQLRLSDRKSLLHALHANVGVISGNLTASLTLLTLVAVSMLVVFIVILAPARSSVHHAHAPTLFWCSAYFLIIGVGFMFVEISLIQRMSLFLGHPIYGLAIVLFSIILATGIGSLWSEQAMPLSSAALVGWPLVLATYLAALPLWLGNVLDAAEPGSLIERATVCLVVVVPAGVVMGFMFPTGMRLCARIDTRITPWLWAVNGAAGVLASGAAILISIETSLNHALWVGAIAYALLSVFALRLLTLGSPRTVEHTHQAATADPGGVVRDS